MRRRDRSIARTGRDRKGRSARIPARGARASGLAKPGGVESVATQPASDLHRILAEHARDSADVAAMLGELRDELVALRIDRGCPCRLADLARQMRELDRRITRECGRRAEHLLELAHV